MKSKTLNGWIFMDYRNNPYMEDKNTIFYGHNLLNKTAFGSLENIFTKDWLDNSNKSIIILSLSILKIKTKSIAPCHYLLILRKFKICLNLKYKKSAVV